MSRVEAGSTSCIATKLRVERRLRTDGGGVGAAALQHAASRTTLCRPPGGLARGPRAHPGRAGTVFENAASAAVQPAGCGSDARGIRFGLSRRWKSGCNGSQFTGASNGIWLLPSASYGRSGATHLESVHWSRSFGLSKCRIPPQPFTTTGCCFTRRHSRV
jgi:hypothetical protein